MSDELRWYREKFDPFVLMGMEGFLLSESCSLRNRTKEKSGQRWSSSERGLSAFERNDGHESIETLRARNN